MRIAEIYFNGILAGVLTEFSATEYTFRYYDDYLLNSSLPAISLTFPKTNQLYRSRSLFPFFFNMLSEGSNRKTQSRLLKIDENDHFGILLATAEYDTGGAITVKRLNNG